MTTATKITFVRVFLIPVFVALLMMGGTTRQMIALAVFIIASVTDFIDGYVARKYNQVSNLGKFLDPLADKLLVTAALMLFVEWGQMPAWAALIVITREFAVTGLRLIAVEKGIVIAAAWSGKIKTASSLVCICLMLLPIHTAILFAGLSVDIICTAVIVATTVWSGTEYFIKNIGVFSDKK